MNVDKKIASNDTTSVRKVKGNGSICGIPGPTLITIHTPNQMTWTQTKVVLPQNFATTSATLSERVRSCLADSSSSLISSTFRCVRSWTEPSSAAGDPELKSMFFMFFLTSEPGAAVNSGPKGRKG